MVMHAPPHPAIVGMGREAATRASHGRSPRHCGSLVKVYGAVAITMLLYRGLNPRHSAAEPG